MSARINTVEWLNKRVDELELELGMRAVEVNQLYQELLDTRRNFDALLVPELEAVKACTDAISGHIRAMGGRIDKISEGTTWPWLLRAEGCVRCGAPYDGTGACSKRNEGCQGGRGESSSA